jgi:hypothetical protein
MRNKSMIDKSEKRILIYSLIVFKSIFHVSSADITVRGKCDKRDLESNDRLQAESNDKLLCIYPKNL